jgi:hypothetical protein
MDRNKSRVTQLSRIALFEVFAAAPCCRLFSKALRPTTRTPLS